MRIDPNEVVIIDPNEVEIVAAPEPQQSAPANTIGQEAKRQGGLFLRQALSAAGSVGAIPADAIGKAVNYVAGREVVPNQKRAFQNTLTRMGLPEPERTIEKFGQGFAESAPAMALPAGIVPQVLGNAAMGAAQAPAGSEGSGAAWGAAGGAAMPALGGVLRATGRGAAHVLGTTTGAGGESVRQAFRDAPGFVENMRGHVEPGTVVDSARQGIHTMRQNMQADYRAAVPQWATGHPIDFAPVDRAYNNLVGTLQHGGQWKIGQNEIRTVDEIGQVLNEFRANSANHTAEGFDALKQRLQAIYPESPNYRQAQRAVTTMADAVRNQISAQSPVYADAMRNYWQRSQQLDEIERSLSLGDRNTVDTALRKLQSLMRNNVNSNFGQRVQSASALEQMGGVEILPQVAGQAMNSWTPRGLQGAAGIGGSIVNPSAIPALPVMSPRVVGEAARYSGMVVNDPRTAAILEALRRSTPAALRASQMDEGQQP